MRSRRTTVLVVLALWVLLGPIAMAYDGCASMCALLEGPCVGAAALGAPAPSTVLTAFAAMGPALRSHLPGNTFAAVDPPPKSARHSA